MKDLNDFYLQKENVKNKLKLLEKEENEGMETLEKNYIIFSKRKGSEINSSKKKKNCGRKKMKSKKNTLFNRTYFSGERSKRREKSF